MERKRKTAQILILLLLNCYRTKIITEEKEKKTLVYWANMNIYWKS